jgi:hypothetical protein
LSASTSVVVIVAGLLSALFMGLAAGPLLAGMGGVTAFPAHGPTVMAIFYGWYGYGGDGAGGVGTSHWNDGPYGRVCDAPQIGYYASGSNTTLDWQFAAMRRVGITALLAEWDGRPQTDAVLGNLFRYATNTEFQIALMVDMPGDVNYRQVYDHAWASFASAYPSYFKWAGAPLLVWYNKIAPPRDDRFTARTIGVGSAYDWEWLKSIYPPTSYDGPLGTLSAGVVTYVAYYGNPRISSDGAVTIMSHYNDYALYYSGIKAGYMIFNDPRTWNSELAFVNANRATIRLVVVNSWNEYHERTAIEPSTPTHTASCRP